MKVCLSIPTVLFSLSLIKKRKEKEKKNNIAHRLGNLSHVDMWFPQLNFMPIWAFALVKVYLATSVI